MKAAICVFGLLLLTGWARAQVATPTVSTQAGGTAAATQAGAPSRGTQSAPAPPPMSAMAADLAQMHALLNAMRSGYASMDSKNQAAMQANIEMWQLLLNHMDQMMQHMQAMHEMEDMHGMHERNEASPAGRTPRYGGPRRPPAPQPSPTPTPQ